MPIKLKKDIEKQANNLEIIESLISKYKKRLLIRNKKWFNLFTISEKLFYVSKVFIFKDNLCLYLLIKKLYRILDRSIKDFNLRNLIKNEILKAPKGTFSEFVNLFNLIKKEFYS